MSWSSIYRMHINLVVLHTDEALYICLYICLTTLCLGQCDLKCKYLSLGWSIGHATDGTVTARPGTYSFMFHLEISVAWIIQPSLTYNCLLYVVFKCLGNYSKFHKHLSSTPLPLHLIVYCYCCVGGDSSIFSLISSCCVSCNFF